MSDRTVYFGGSVPGPDGFDVFFAVDAETGSERWRFETQGTFTTAPAAGHGVVYVGLSNGGPSVVALDGLTGEECWRFFTPDEVRSRPVVVDGVVYFSTVFQIFALDARSGELFWQSDGRGMMLADGSLEGGTLHARGVVGGRFESTLITLDAETGRLLSSISTPDALDPQIVDGVVYAGGSTDVVAFDLESGETRWSVQLALGGSDGWAGGVRVADGLVFATARNAFHALDATTGEIRWRAEGAGALFSLPAIAAGTAYTGIDGLFAFDTKTGTQLWHVETAGPAYATPVVAGSVVYFTSLDGYLYAVAAE